VRRDAAGRVTGEPRTPGWRVTRPPAGGPWPTASTRPVVLLGWPARHSISPELHNAAFAEHDLDLVYLALPTRADDLLGVVRMLGAVGAIGANVTIPHKRAVVPACDVLTREAELIGAVNTLAWGADGLVGDNTDATGLHGALTTDLALSADAEVVVFGTGGAARAAVVAVGRIGCRLTVIGRRAAAAEELAAMGELAGAGHVAAVDLGDPPAVAAAVARARVVLNATSLGMQGEELPTPFHQLTADQVAYDLVYAPPQTPFLAAARRNGAEAHNGLGMLIGQAAAAYRRWTGRDAPLGILSAAALAALTDTYPGAPTDTNPSALTDTSSSTETGA
jgi:shikimate dehydrogenase